MIKAIKDNHAQRLLDKVCVHGNMVTNARNLLNVCFGNLESQKMNTFVHGNISAKACEFLCVKQNVEISGDNAVKLFQIIVLIK